MLDTIMAIIFGLSFGAAIWNWIGAFKNDGIPFNPVRERKLWNGIGFGCIMILMLMLKGIVQ